MALQHPIGRGLAESGIDGDVCALWEHLIAELIAENEAATIAFLSKRFLRILKGLLVCERDINSNQTHTHTHRVKGWWLYSRSKSKRISAPYSVLVIVFQGLVCVCVCVCVCVTRIPLHKVRSSLDSRNMMGLFLGWRGELIRPGL